MPRENELSYGNSVPLRSYALELGRAPRPGDSVEWDFEITPDSTPLDFLFSPILFAFFSHSLILFCAPISGSPPFSPQLIPGLKCEKPSTEIEDSLRWAKITQFESAFYCKI